MPDPFPLRFTLNGEVCSVDVEPRALLLDVLRDRLGLTGTKRSCDIGVCGACTVSVNGQAVSACSLFAFQVNGQDVLTIEGLGTPDDLHPLQQAFIDCGGVQCGFCTPGMILTAKTLLDERPNPAIGEITAYMNGNVCRCTGYQMIVESIARAAGRLGKAAR